MEKIVFCDIDGTILPSSEKISKKTKNTIKKLQAAGITFVLCSGRSRQMVLKVSNQLENNCQFVISSNGGEVYDVLNNKEIFKDCISYKSLCKIYDIANNLGSNIIFKCGEINYLNKAFDYDVDCEIVSKKQLKKVFNSGLVQINVLDSNPSNLLKLIEEVQKIDGVEVSNRSKYLIDPSMFSKTCDNNELFIDINKKGCSKGLGILKLCEYLNIPLSQTISIGDSANDLSMFKQTQVDVAVANSINELKEKADVLTTSNDNDGVASFLEKHFNL